MCWADGLASPGESVGTASAAGALKDPCTPSPCAVEAVPSPLPVPKPSHVSCDLIPEPGTLLVPPPLVRTWTSLMGRHGRGEAWLH